MLVLAYKSLESLSETYHDVLHISANLLLDPKREAIPAPSVEIDIFVHENPKSAGSVYFKVEVNQESKWNHSFRYQVAQSFKKLQVQLWIKCWIPKM